MRIKFTQTREYFQAKIALILKQLRIHLSKSATTNHVADSLENAILLTILGVVVLMDLSGRCFCGTLLIL